MGQNAGLWRTNEDFGSKSAATGNRCVLCFKANNGDEMGRNPVSSFICNIGAWGHVGRNRVSPLEMGIEGGGRGVQGPQAAKDIRRQGNRKLNLTTEIRSQADEARIGAQPRQLFYTTLVRTGRVPELPQAWAPALHRFLCAANPQTWLLHKA